MLHEKVSDDLLASILRTLNQVHDAHRCRERLYDDYDDDDDVVAAAGLVVLHDEQQRTSVPPGVSVCRRPAH